jgi:hypothetical protein
LKSIERIAWFEIGVETILGFGVGEALVGIAVEEGDWIDLCEQATTAITVTTTHD